MDLGDQSRSHRDGGLGLLIAQEQFELFTAMADYIESFYDHAGRHSSIEYLTPMEYEDLHSTFRVARLASVTFGDANFSATSSRLSPRYGFRAQPLPPTRRFERATGRDPMRLGRH